MYGIASAKVSQDAIEVTTSAMHRPEYATLRGRVEINGVPRLLFYVPAENAEARPYLFACGPNGEKPTCECSYRPTIEHGEQCRYIEHAAEIAASVAEADAA